MGKVVVVVEWPLVALTRWALAGGYLKSKRLRTWGRWPLWSDGLWREAVKDKFFCNYKMLTSARISQDFSQHASALKGGSGVSDVLRIWQ